MKLNKNIIIIIEGIIWILLGIEIVRVGFSILDKPLNYTMYFIAILIFLPYFVVFFKLVNRELLRIFLYSEEKPSIFKIFTNISYVIIFINITIAYLFNYFKILPIKYIVVFCYAFGASLFFSGILFLLSYYALKKNKDIKL